MLDELKHLNHSNPSWWPANSKPRTAMLEEIELRPHMAHPCFSYACVNNDRKGDPLGFDVICTPLKLPEHSIICESYADENDMARYLPWLFKHYVATPFFLHEGRLDGFNAIVLEYEKQTGRAFFKNGQGRGQLREYPQWAPYFQWLKEAGLLPLYFKGFNRKTQSERTAADMAVANAMKEAIATLGLTQEQAAGKCKVTLRTMQRWLAGETNVPTNMLEVLKA